ncbi:hypothetical protein A3J20_00905 [Candidatus Gottesmanbacteria bacterium RIFCSPLOWO2_02_FULL_42_29]|uniref:Uncharacterized protein n=2 Tax=Candidatus Gottesmaniibacteriota TaxID=1752720 RepID=A0A1F6BIZ6_9BACT|nr:MAG: hypothetical protein UV09_C0001G0006 [Candidatus Gottesmanbacteria bacterium GW2011_GWA2_42_18]KKS73736.1 MAG: hypothetical protein UV46_C0064G0005 [Candidatus Gottesmanbacteria bacterium GW2011_GWC2_42_8]OGG11149.1 MAG: hypothetical protein A2781_05180 [Candidatus Gottesmanbacteria bacterium RIFCSPHIGHO2_01_FULL_42_27]OGG21801.1 MAG: hypothetical protein A3E72_04785 [Candidatus Gottesmanbacteria bacterium RIFCSPHIGHO2_12_FULL_43_26]OGG33583.1 MAG: hypothetical protein A3G68_06110 [Cand
MDVSYNQSRKKSFLVPLVLALIVLLLIAGSILAVSNRRKFLSPLPETPAYEIIFYTPTPEPLTPTSSPSATVKAEAKATVTSKPSPKATVTEAVSPTTALSLTPKP